jgi:gliding motility-associated-like protein
MVNTPGGTAEQSGFIFVIPEPIVKEGSDPAGIVVANDQKSSVDVGQTNLFNDLEKEFVIENLGTSPLVVQSISSTNKKFTIEEIPTIVAPGSFTGLTVQLDASEVGVFTSVITIQFNEGTYEFTVKGEVLYEADPPIEVFNLLSPNGDGAHDFLKISNIEFYVGNSVSVFTRWGDKVFEMTQYSNSLSDKRFEGVSNTSGRGLLDDGTYYYVIDTGRAKKLTGFLLLKR